MDGSDDDDAPPMLVASDGTAGGPSLVTDMEDVKISRVPITIITGRVNLLW